MDDNLMVHFVDGSDVEVKFLFDERTVEVIAYDEKTKLRYKLIFSECINFEMNYTEEEEIDLWNLTEGIHEEKSNRIGIREFDINFIDDDVVLKISCRKFIMQSIDEKRG